MLLESSHSLRGCLAHLSLGRQSSAWPRSPKKGQRKNNKRLRLLDARHGVDAPRERRNVGLEPPMPAGCSYLRSGGSCTVGRGQTPSRRTHGRDVLDGLRPSIIDSVEGDASLRPPGCLLGFCCPVRAPVARCQRPRLVGVDPAGCVYTSKSTPKESTSLDKGKPREHACACG
jgi:hypothetical protein